MVSVRFIYDEGSTLWDVVVEGAESDLEALDAVAAVITTCKHERVTGHGVVLEKRADGSREIGIGVL